MAEEGIDKDAVLNMIKEADEKDVPKKEEVEKVEMEFCPHCGYDPNKESLHITDEDKKEFYRCMMALRPFTKTFEMWNGDLKITMKSLTSDEADLMNKKIRSLSFEGSELLETAIKLKILFMCKEIHTKETAVTNTSPDEVDDMDVTKTFSHVFQVPETVIRLLSRTYTQFEAIVESMNNEGFDENFYMGGGGA